MNSSLTSLYRKGVPEGGSPAPGEPSGDGPVTVPPISTAPPRTRVSMGGWFIDKGRGVEEKNILIDLCQDDDASQTMQTDIPMLETEKKLKKNRLKKGKRRKEGDFQGADGDLESSIMNKKGANTGIGKTTALELAKRGARVILACRNQERAEAAVRDIKRESGNAEVVYMQLDLASLKSVRSFAETFLKTEPRLDLLINNAGLCVEGKTEDGFGMVFGVNHLGPFLLTLLLLERLKECGSSRVINVSSIAYTLGAIDFNYLSTHKALGEEGNVFQYWKLYSHSKLCNLLFTHELARRLQGTSVTCYSLHPDSGAQTTLHCALQEGIEPLSGRYFSDCVAEEVLPKAKDDAVARKLWEVSERLSGLS